MNKRSRKGFTIIEMVIVITIIGILAAVLIPTYSNVVSKANASSALQTARSTMVNWLAESGLENGRPVAELREVNGTPVYAAYFQYTTDRTYQFRYANGSIEEVTGTGHYKNFGADDPHFIVYLEREDDRRNRAEQAGEGYEDEKYKADVYMVKLPGTPPATDQYVFYTRYAADSAYAMGSADVLACSEEKVYFYDNNDIWYELGSMSGELYLEETVKRIDYTSEVFVGNDSINGIQDFTQKALRENVKLEKDGLFPDGLELVTSTLRKNSPNKVIISITREFTDTTTFVVTLTHATIGNDPSGSTQIEIGPVIITPGEDQVYELDNVIASDDATIKIELAE